MTIKSRTLSQMEQDKAGPSKDLQIIDSIQQKHIFSLSVSFNAVDICAGKSLKVFAALQKKDRNVICSLINSGPVTDTRVLHRAISLEHMQRSCPAIRDRHRLIHPRIPRPAT
ncbi:unnamed protein product [Mycena citricolor]|uniref:Uncharacterized protein n=1 Tax=Mycena citricolor TaxID=2018698 RepID=A0AAD2K8A9_9AGAR|nr:unnamed protein product [Mycena citricolor]